MKRSLAWLTLPLLASLLVVAAPALSQGQQRGDASLRLEFQYIRTGDFLTGDFPQDWWTTDTQVALLSGDYAINDRWTVFAALPYVRKRFNAKDNFPIPGFVAGDPHNPNDPYWIDFVPTDKRVWDTGGYHGALQDFSMGVTYSVAKGPWTLHPYISYGVPASNYPFYAKSAIGLSLWTVPVGTTISFVPYFSDWHFDGNVAYVFSEKPLGVNVDYWTVHLSAGYWFKANLSVNAFFSLKSVRDGILQTDPVFLSDDASSPPVYPEDYDTEIYYQHDRVVSHRNLNFGLGIDYFFSPKWKVSGSSYQSIWTEETNEVDFAFTLGLTRFYGGE